MTMKIILGDDDDDDDEDGDDDDDAFQVVLKRVFDLMGTGSQTHEVTELLLLFSTTQLLQRFTQFYTFIYFSTAQQLQHFSEFKTQDFSTTQQQIRHFSEIVCTLDFTKINNSEKFKTQQQIQQFSKIICVDFLEIQHLSEIQQFNNRSIIIIDLCKIIQYNWQLHKSV